MKLKGLARLFLAAIPVVAIGAPVTLTFSGDATGTLGSTAFTDAPFTLTSTGDTSAVFSIPATYYLPVTSSMISIDGFSPVSFTDPGSWYDPQGAGDVVFQGTQSQSLGFTALFVGLEAYQFSSSIGPISGFAFAPNVILSFTDLSTSGGLLTITGTSTHLTFEASAAPEPSTGWLIGGGVSIVSLLIAKRRAAVEE